MNQTGFSPADLLLPKNGSMEQWSVVACDQYTSEPEYWERVEKRVGDAPSTLRLVLPEAYLESSDVNARICAINETMERYLTQGIFTEYSDSYLYVERATAAGKIRRGLLGKIDLEAYDYGKGSQSAVRPTEGTVESRLPPRIKVREHALLELPHIMVLIDDPEKTVVEPLALQTERMEPAYAFTLMEQGGQIRGWRVNEENRRLVDAALEALESRVREETERIAPGKAPLFIAVGDGNHSLATAKACWENLKRTLPQAAWAEHPARYALVELVNVHDDALEFEPIHRVLFGVEPKKVLEEFKRYYRTSETGEGQTIGCVWQGGRAALTVENPPAQLAVGTLQKFVDAYLEKHGGQVDYIHGADVAKQLGERENAIAFLLPVMKKAELFRTVLLDGALPRKTFSMGHAFEKRYYLECRKIR